ncbi:MAG: isochorismatase family protein [Candidatus Gastranaerophilales bacterium]|nr:isochorismatase family protein [Candidatus Gastranaerophilales bacterium]
MSSILNNDNVVLLIIDLQDRLLAAQPKSEKILKSTIKLAKAARILNIPIIATEQYPQGLGNTNLSLAAELALDAKIFEKTDFDCLKINALVKYLKDLNRTQVIVCGVETHVCVHQTVSSLINNFFEVHLAQDCCGSRNKFEHKIGLKRMYSEKAIPSCCEMVIFELLKSSKHPDFKEIQGLIK